MTTFGSMTIGGEGAIELEFHSSCSGARQKRECNFLQESTITPSSTKTHSLPSTDYCIMSMFVVCHIPFDPLPMCV